MDRRGWRPAEGVCGGGVEEEGVPTERGRRLRLDPRGRKVNQIQEGEVREAVLKKKYKNPCLLFYLIVLSRPVQTI